MRTTQWILVATLAASAASLGLACQAQDATSTPSSTDTLAAAARRAREDKKTQPTKSVAVFTNDNLPTAGTISVVGSSSAPAAKTDAAAATPAAQTTTKAGDADAQKKSSADADKEALASAKEKLANVKKDLDLLQRTFNLDQQTYLSSPNHDSDTAGAAKLESEKGQIADKQTEVDVAQNLVDTLKAKLPPDPADQAAPPADGSSSTPSDAHRY